MSYQPISRDEPLYHKLDIQERYALREAEKVVYARYLAERTRLHELATEMHIWKQEYKPLLGQYMVVSTSPRCTGAISGRHCIHGMGQSCPMHGQPERGGRVRVSVGQSAMPEVTAAIANNARAHELHRQLSHMRGRINSHRRELGMIPIDELRKP